MKLSYKIKFSILSLMACFGFTACVDDDLDMTGSTLPEEFKENYSISFRMSLDPMGGNEFRSRAGEDRLKEIEDYVDLENLRILFFTCVDPEETGKPSTYWAGGKEYETGVNDIFLFESNSRWVSEMTSTSFNASKLWQVTTPVFSYGNQDKDYDEATWKNIREALMTRPFKIVILANKPPTSLEFYDYDYMLAEHLKVELGEDGKPHYFFDNDGPKWTVNDSWATGKTHVNKPTINDLHHCQWDPVYTSKNFKQGLSGSAAQQDKKFNGNNVYDFIMGNPSQEYVKEKPDKTPTNLMGATSAWTEKGDEKTVYGVKSNNHYIKPSKDNPIPMYGTQKFEPIKNWPQGTPFNVSDNQKGQDNTYDGKIISLLRSVVRLDLMIPKYLGSGTNRKKVIVDDPVLCYSNVMARWVPLDAATPTEQIWSKDNCNEVSQECEWYRLQNYGPIINSGDLESADVGDETNDPTLAAQLERVRVQFVQRTAWFYGAWKVWWDFNNDKNIAYPYFGDDSPHIFNPCVQRNGMAFIDGNLVEDDDFYHYVVYTGERNINDPTNFRSMKIEDSKICYFQFKIRYDNQSASSAKSYSVAVTNYQENELIKKFLSSGVDLEKEVSGVGNYRNLMIKGDEGLAPPSSWNWVLLRNHIYRFQITEIAGNLDEGGIDGMVISTEERAAPTITYN